MRVLGMNRFVLAVACAASTQLMAMEREGGGRLGALAVEVAFVSPGNGIYQEAKDEIVDLSAEQLKQGKVTQINGKSWGREGEFTLCVQFTDPVLAYEFQKEIAPIIEADPSAIVRTSAKRILNCGKKTVPLPHV